jgi:hypothetical protein
MVVYGHGSFIWFADSADVYGPESPTIAEFPEENSSFRQA